MTDIKLITKDTDLSTAYNLNWDVTIGDKLYSVYRVDGCVHTIGGRMYKNNLWCCPRNESLTFENAIAFRGEPVRFGLKVNPINCVKNKYDETSMESAIKVDILRNDDIFYTFSCRDFSYGVAKAQTLIAELEEHPINFFRPDYVQHDIINRRVYYRSEPGIITQWCSEGQACVIIEPDGINEFKCPTEFSEDELFDEERKYIKADIFDKNIYWFRH